MKLNLVPFALLLLAACRSTPESFTTTEMPEDMPVFDFTLTDQFGNPFKLSDHRGKVVLMFFGYTYCPDVCPLTLSNWRRVQDGLGKDAARVEFVYITVDPERDTREKLKNHIAVFSNDFYGLTGAPEDLREVYSDFGVISERNDIAESATGYLIDHTSRIFVLDRTGKWRLAIRNDAPVEDIVHDVRLLLREKI